MSKFNDILAVVMGYLTRAWAAIKDLAARLVKSALAVYSNPLTWLAVGAVFVVAYTLGFGQGIYGKRELRQRAIAATTTRDIVTKRLATVERERNVLADRVRTLEETLAHPPAPPEPPIKKGRRHLSAKE